MKLARNDLLFKTVHFQIGTICSVVLMMITMAREYCLVTMSAQSAIAYAAWHTRSSLFDFSRSQTKEIIRFLFPRSIHAIPGTFISPTMVVLLHHIYVC